MDNIEKKDIASESNIGEQAVDEKKKKADKVYAVQNTILAYLHDLVFLLVALLLLFVILFRIVVVSGPSMKNTLLDGDYLLVLSSSIYTNPKQGDVVVISKDSFKSGEPIVKRVIATEGQTVRIEGGQVFVNGVKVDGEITDAVDMPSTFVVSEGCIFVMGDNRNESKDSRSNEIGMIDKREVLGKVLIIALPAVDPATGKRNFSRFGAV